MDKPYKYKWDGTDKHVLRHFQVALYDREISVLNKYDFDEEISEDSFDDEELNILLDLKTKGMIYSFMCNKREYFSGTILYKQLKDVTY